MLLFALGGFLSSAAAYRLTDVGSFLPIFPDDPHWYSGFSAFDDPREQNIKVFGLASTANVDDSHPRLWCLPKWQGLFRGECKEGTTSYIVDLPGLRWITLEYPRSNPSIMSCPRDSKLPPPSSVVISDSPDCLGNSIQIPITKPRPTPHYTIAACLLPREGWDMQYEFLKWLPVARELGVEFITYYETQPPYPSLSAEMEKATNSADVEVVPFNVLNETYYYGEMVALQDCTYRNAHRVKWLVTIDSDEFLLPTKTSETWYDLVKRGRGKQALIYLHSFCPPVTPEISHVIPPFCYGPQALKFHMKGFVQPNLVVKAFTHFPMKVSSHKNRFKYLDADEAVLFHFRKHGYNQSTSQRKAMEFDFRDDDLVHPPAWMLERPWIQEYWDYLGDVASENRDREM